MPEMINVSKAKTQYSKLLERAHAGEEIVICKAGIPYARLVPLAAQGKRRLGGVSGSVGPEFFEPLPPSELDARDGVESAEA